MAAAHSPGVMGDPIPEGLVQLSDALGKKMIASRYDDELSRLGKFIDEISHFVAGAEGIFLALNE